MKLPTNGKDIMLGIVRAMSKLFKNSSKKITSYKG
jgi:hypothetical protein